MVASYVCSVFCTLALVHLPSFLCPTAVAIRVTSPRLWISLKTIFLWFIVDSFDHQRWGWRPRPALLFVTVPIIYFILRADSAFCRATFAFHFRLVITEGWALFTSGSWDLRSIWKSRASPNLNSPTSDNVDELYSATFVKEFSTPNNFLVYSLINRSTFVIDTSYICIGHDDLGENPK